MVLESATGAAMALYGEPWAGLGLALGSVGGWFITPDADHHVKTHEEDRVEEWPVVGPYLQGVWAGYGSKYDHRGRSHWHVWGTVTRMWYFARRFMADFLFWAYVVGVIFLGQVMDGELVAQVVLHLPRGGFLGFLFLGWCVQDSVHIETDRLWSWWRSKKGRRQRGRVVRGVVWSGILIVVVWIFMNS